MSFFTNLRADRLITEIRAATEPESPALQKAVARLKDLGAGAIEPVFAAHGGRPHWAKRHSLTADDVLRLYPDARRWGEVRKRVDPEGKFLNAHLRDQYWPRSLAY